MRSRIHVSSLLALCLPGLAAVACSASPGGESAGVSGEAVVGSTSYDSSCHPADQQNLDIAFTWGRIAASSPAFAECISRSFYSATNGGYAPGNFNVGPYISCSADPDVSPQIVLSQVKTANPTSIACDYGKAGTDTGGYAYIGNIGLDNGVTPEVITMGNTLGYFSGATQGCFANGNVKPCIDDFGYTANAEVILHEIMHQHGYNHVEPPDLCGTSPAQKAQYGNGIPYMVNECLSAVLQASDNYCGASMHTACGAGLSLVSSTFTSQPTCGCVSDPTPGAPATVVRPSGEVDVVVQGAFNSLIYYWKMPGGGWGQHALGGPGSTYSAPSMFVRASGEVDVVAQGPNNSLEYYWAQAGGAWYSAQIGGNGSTFSAPSIFVRPNGEADVVAIGPQDSLAYYWDMPGQPFNHGQVAGSGTTFSQPAIFVRPSGEADIAAQGPDFSLRYYSATPGSSWTSHTLAGAMSTFSAPSLFVRQNGEADVAVQGANDSLMYYHSQAVGWGSTQVAPPGTTFSAPSLFVRSSGEADIVARGASNALSYYWASPGTRWWSAAIAAAGTTVSAPVVVVQASGEADVTTIGADGMPTYLSAIPGGAWTTSHL